MNRDQFETELATELARYYPAGAESLAASLKKMRDGDSYADQSVTGAGIAWAAKYAWWAWKAAAAKIDEDGCWIDADAVVTPQPPTVEYIGRSLGHGHVTPRPDGLKAKCGGPGLCKVCHAEQARKLAQ